jgi:hypothetical protein
MQSENFICKPGLRRVLDAIKNMAAEIEATQRTSFGWRESRHVRAGMRL